MKLIDKNTNQEYYFDESKIKRNKSICPVCSHTRKKKLDKCLSWKPNLEAAKCFNCDSILYIPVKKMEEKPTYKKPEWNNKTELSDSLVKWFEEERGITQDTLIKAKVTEGLEWMPQVNKKVNTIHFNYFFGEELKNVKYRDGKKNFKLFQGGELLPYNINSIVSSEICIICEGEIDCLTYIEIGQEWCVSVPNGAQNNSDWLNDYYHFFENKEKIILSTDNDEKGEILKKELIRRFGEEVCYTIDLEGEKDANDYKKKYGGERLRKVIDNAEPLPVDGIVTVESIENELDDLYHNGFSKGMELGYKSLDELITFETARLLTVTGIPGMGKSEFVDDITTRLNYKFGLKFGYFSPENAPYKYHSMKLIEKIIGKKFNVTDMNGAEYLSAKIHVNRNFYMIDPSDDDYTIDNILKKAKALVRRYGINGLVIDPWNYIEMDLSKSTETKFVDRTLTRIKSFAKKYNLLIILVAHPTKMQKKEGTNQYKVPTMYDISGSSNFFNKTDFGITVYRNYDFDTPENDHVEIYVQKVKFKHLGRLGSIKMKYNKDNGRFAEWNEFTDAEFIKNPYIKIENELYDELTSLEPNNNFEDE